MRAFIVIGAAFLAITACSSPKPGTEGADCPNDNNCLEPLRCIQNVCTAVAATDAGTPDTGVVDAGPVDTGVPDLGTPDTGLPPEYDQNIAGGTLNPTPDGTTLGFGAATGRSFFIREDTGYSNALVSVSGLTPDTTYTAHIHAKACNDEVGGGHYKIDTNVAEVIEANEIWIRFTTDADGDGVGTVRVNHYARRDAVSVVIHQPGTGEKLICGDLSPNADLTANGTFIELPDGAGSGITGSASLRRYSGGTEVEVNVTGTLMPNGIYPTHVHVKACDDEAAGGHYKLDTSVAEVVQDNEIWPNVAGNSAGTGGGGTIQVDHIARYEARSIVIHDPASGNKLLCADLAF